MWTNIRLICVQRSFVRNYAKKPSKLKRQLAVLKQEVDSIPKYEYNRSKPTDRRVYVWGQALTGACGFNQSLHDQKLAKIVKHPTRLPFAERFDVIDIAAGYGFTLFACKPEKDDITLFGCGLNTDSQLGFQKHGGQTNKPMELLYYPAPIALPKAYDDENLNIIKVAAGRAHSIALSQSNVLFTLGNNSYGQCGRAIIEDEKFHSSEIIHRIDVKIIIGNDDKVKVKPISF